MTGIYLYASLRVRVKAKDPEPSQCHVDHDLEQASLSSLNDRRIDRNEVGFGVEVIAYRRTCQRLALGPVSSCVGIY